MTRARYGICPLCQREVDLTFHHLIPKKLHRRTRFQKSFTRDELNQGLEICRQCHAGIHKTHDEMHLAKTLNSLELLKADPMLAKHFMWVGRQKISSSAR